MHIFNTRKATLDDAADIARLASELGYPSKVEQCHARLQGLLLSSEHRVLVACDALNIVVGWIHVYLAYHLESDPFAEIGGLVVSADYQKSGLGTMLITEVENWLKKSGIKKLRVRSRTERDDAKIFYKKMGFDLSKQQNVFDKIL